MHVSNTRQEAKITKLPEGGTHAKTTRKLNYQKGMIRNMCEETTRVPGNLLSSSSSPSFPYPEFKRGPLRPSPKGKVISSGDLQFLCFFHLIVLVDVGL
jgi:hypothetical protein